MNIIYYNLKNNLKNLSMFIIILINCFSGCIDHLSKQKNTVDSKIYNDIKKDEDVNINNNAAKIIEKNGKKTIIYTVKEPFVGNQSPDYARVNALAKAKREVLELAGTYLESLATVKNGAIKTNEVLAIAAGILNVEIISDEKYLEDDLFGIKIVVKVDVDNSILEKRIKKYLSDRTIMEEYIKIQKREKQLLEKIKELEIKNQKLLISSKKQYKSKKQILAKQLNHISNELLEIDKKQQKLSSMFNFHYNSTVDTNYDAKRIKSIYRLQNDFTIKLIGVGKVVGLPNTGDIIGDIVQNTAQVIVNAEMHSYNKIGSRIDVKVSSIGNATDIRNGHLSRTKLKGSDNQIYAIAQGLINYGLSPTSSEITNGANIENELSYNFNKNKEIKLVLEKPDFTTAARIIETINNKFHEKVASANDPGCITIKVPKSYQPEIIKYTSFIENLKVIPDTSGTIVIDRLNGHIIEGGEIEILPVTISKEDVVIKIVSNENKIILSPSEEVEYQRIYESKNDTNIFPKTIYDEENMTIILPSNCTINNLLKELKKRNKLNSNFDTIRLIELLKEAGGIQASIDIR